MRDVDRFVDGLYEPAIEALQLPFVKSEWHRYAGDLNRLPEDIDQASVEGAASAPGTFTNGFFWVKTTQGELLMPKPVSQLDYKKLVAQVFEPFHNQVKALYQDFKSKGHGSVYHLDLHSMPSIGTEAHRDPGERRAEVVISDQEGKSCNPAFLNLAVQAFRDVGFQVAINWPYKGGRVTQTYGRPELGQHCLQIELNRSLYMNEVTKQLRPDQAEKLQTRLSEVLKSLMRELRALS